MSNEFLLTHCSTIAKPQSFRPFMRVNSSYDGAWKVNILYNMYVFECVCMLLFSVLLKAHMDSSRCSALPSSSTWHPQRHTDVTPAPCLAVAFLSPVWKCWRGQGESSFDLAALRLCAYCCFEFFEVEVTLFLSLVAFLFMTLSWEAVKHTEYPQSAHQWCMLDKRNEKQPWESCGMLRIYFIQ